MKLSLQKLPKGYLGAIKNNDKSNNLLENNFASNIQNKFGQYGKMHISAYSELFMKIKRNNRIWSIHNTLPLSLLLSHFSKDKK